MIEHGGDTIEPEAVHHVFLHIPAKIGEEETKDLPLGAVKNFGVPKSMISLK